MNEQQRAFDGAGVEEKLDQILDCLQQMNEQYQYILCQLNDGE